MPAKKKKMYYRRRRENESRHLVTRKGDWILLPHECEKCWFVNLCGRCPDSGGFSDSQTLAVLRRANSDIFWSHDTSNIHGMLWYSKWLVSRYRKAGRAVPLLAITAWPVGYEVGMGMEIQMLEKLLSNGKNGRNYLQANTVGQLQVAASNVYSATVAAHFICYSLKSHWGIVLHVYEETMQS